MTGKATNVSKHEILNAVPNKYTVPLPELNIKRLTDMASDMTRSIKSAQPTKNEDTSSSIYKLVCSTEILFGFALFCCKKKLAWYSHTSHVWKILKFSIS